MGSPRTIDLDGLLEHTEWVRRLARSLVSDPQAAEDIAQETWLAALTSRTRPHTDAHGARGWLGGIVRNLTRRNYRREGARRDYEDRACSAGGQPGADELLLQAELQERIIGEVRRLDEPYRTTVLLRYFEGLTVEELSRRQGIPGSTGRSRLSRALAQLRERFDREYGDRGTWCALLAGVAGKAGVMEVVAMSTNIPLMIGGAVAIGAALVWWDPLRPQGHAAAPVTEVDHVVAGVEPADASQSSLNADAQAVLAEERRFAATASPADVLLYGLLVTTTGEPLTEGRIDVYDALGEPRRASIGAPGTFSILGLEPGPVTLHVACYGVLPTTVRFEVTGEPLQRHDLVLAPAASLLVRFEDPEGELIGALEEHREAYPTAVATLAPPPVQLPGVTGREVRYYGISTYRHANANSRDDIPRGVSGVLELRAPLPLHVSAVVRGVVLQTQFVRTGTEDVRFVLDPEDLRAVLATASIRLVDADTGAPITEGRADLNHSQTGGRGRELDENGGVTFESVLPGILEVSTSVQGYEYVKKRVRIEPGVHNDLGTLALSPSVPLRGRVVDEEGNPLSVVITCVALRHLEMPFDVDTRYHWESDTEGNFELAAGRGRLLVQAGREDWPLTPFVIENPPEKEVELVLRKGTTVVFEPGGLGHVHTQLTLATAGGVPFWTRTLRSDHPLDMSLAPGSYQAWLGQDERVDRKFDLVVGEKPRRVELEEVGKR